MLRYHSEISIAKKITAILFVLTLVLCGTFRQAAPAAAQYADGTTLTLADLAANATFATSETEAKSAAVPKSADNTVSGVVEVEEPTEDWTGTTTIGSGGILYVAPAGELTITGTVKNNHQRNFPFQNDGKLTFSNAVITNDTEHTGLLFADEEGVTSFLNTQITIQNGGHNYYSYGYINVTGSATVNFENTTFTEDGSFVSIWNDAGRYITNNAGSTINFIGKNTFNNLDGNGTYYGSINNYNAINIKKSSSTETEGATKFNNSNLTINSYNSGEGHGIWKIADGAELSFDGTTIRLYQNSDNPVFQVEAGGKLSFVNSSSIANTSSSANPRILVKFGGKLDTTGITSFGSNFTANNIVVEKGFSEPVTITKTWTEENGKTEDRPEPADFLKYLTLTINGTEYNLGDYSQQSENTFSGYSGMIDSVTVTVNDATYTITVTPKPFDTNNITGFVNVTESEGTLTCNNCKFLDETVVTLKEANLDDDGLKYQMDGSVGGSITDGFTITNKYLGNKYIVVFQIEEDELQKTYNGEIQEPDIWDVLLDGKSTYDTHELDGKYELKYYSDEAGTTEAEPKNAGTYYVKPVLVGLGDDYVIASGSQTFVLTIAKAAVTVEKENQNTNYTGEPQKPTVTISGLVESDVEKCSELRYSLSGGYDPDQVIEVDTFGYYFTIQGFKDSTCADNYNYRIADGDPRVILRIYKREVDVNWTNTTLEYNGSAQAPTAEFYSEIPEGEPCAENGICQRDLGKCRINVTGAQTNVGKYTGNDQATASAIADAVSRQNCSKNYAFKSDGNLKTDFEITKIQLKVNWPENQSTEYSGSAVRPTPESVSAKNDPEATVPVTVNDLTISYQTADGTPITDESEPKSYGTYKAIAELTNETYTGNYEIGEGAEYEYYITRTLAKYSDPTAAEGIVYDGNPHELIVLGTGEEEGGTWSYEVSADKGSTWTKWTGEGVPTAVNAGSYQVKATFTADKNHDLPNVASDVRTHEVTLDTVIGKAKVTITEWSGLEDADLVYSGSVKSPKPTAGKIGEAAAPAELISSITVSYHEGTAEGEETEPKNAGTYAAVATLTDDNYELDEESANQEFTITPVTAVIVWDETPLFYNGKDQAPKATLNTSVEADKTKCVITVEVIGEHKNAGPYLAAVKSFTDEECAKNYDLEAAEDNTMEYTIGKALLEIESWSGSPFTYDGQEHAPAATVKADGLKESDSCTVKVTVSGTGLTDGKAINAGSYNAEAGEFNEENCNTNYNLSDVNKSTEFTIDQLEAQLTWSGSPFTYDGTTTWVPAAEVSNLVGDSCDVTVSGGQVNAGTYTATATELSNSNYKLPANATSEFVVNKAVLTAAWKNTEGLVYGGTPDTPEIDTIKNGETDVTDLYKSEVVYSWEKDGQKLDEKPTDAGDYTVVAAIDSDNYQLSEETAKQPYTIGKADPTDLTDPAPVSEELTYSGEPQELAKAGASEQGTWMYKDPVSGEWSDKVPTATDANEEGYAPVQAYFKGDENHNDKGSESEPLITDLGSTKIMKADIPDSSYTAPSLIADELPYTGKAQDLIKAGEWTDESKKYGEFQYATDNENFVPKEVGAYSTAIPQGTERGTYDVRWKIEPDNNHKPVVGTLNPVIGNGVITEADIKIPSSPVADGTEKTLEFSVVLENGYELVPGTDYEVVYDPDDETVTDKATEPGTYTLRIKGLGNFEGIEVSKAWNLLETPPEPTFNSFEFFPLRGFWDRELNCPSFGCGTQLPATGFPTHRTTPLSVKPAEVTYSDLKMRLMIPTLSLDTEMVGVPTYGDEWSVEWLGGKAGLLSGTAEPGRGYTMIAGHNHINTDEMGPFADLGALKEFDRIFIRMDNGMMLPFSVYANELVKPDDYQRIAEVALEDPHSLVLVTCENESADGGYLNRRVVFAKPY